MVQVRAILRKAFTAIGCLDRKRTANQTTTQCYFCSHILQIETPIQFSIVRGKDRCEMDRGVVNAPADMV